jgi:hypothetical protein
MTDSRIVELLARPIEEHRQRHPTHRQEDNQPKVRRTYHLVQLHVHSFPRDEIVHSCGQWNEERDVHYAHDHKPDGPVEREKDLLDVVGEDKGEHQGLVYGPEALVCTVLVYMVVLGVDGDIVDESCTQK